MERPAHDGWWLALLLLVAAGLRVAGVGAGLPGLWHADEKQLVERAMIMGGGDLNPHFFMYPSLLMYLYLLLNGALYAAQRLVGIVATPEEFAVRFFVDPTAQFLTGRLFSAACGVVSVIVVWRLGRRLCSPRVGLLAAALLAVAPLHVMHSQIAKADSLMVLLVLITHLLLVRFMSTGSASDLLGAGLATGLAVATKYNAALLVVSIVVVLVLRRQAEGQHAAAIAGDRRVWSTAAVAAGAFLLAAPYTILDASGFLKDVFRLGTEVFDEQPSREGFGPAWAHHLTVSLGRGFGWLPLALSVLGIVVMVTRRVAWTLPVVTFPLVTLVVVSVGDAVYSRWGLPTIPLLTIPAAVAIDWLSERVPSTRRVGLAVLVTVTLVQPAVTSVWVVSLLRTEDTREAARRWIERMIPGNSVIAMDRYGPDIVETPETFLARQKDRGRVRTLATRGAAERLAARPVRYEIVELEPTRVDVEDLHARRVSHVVVSSYVRDRLLVGHQSGPKEFYDALERRATLVASFSACGEPCRRLDVPSDDFSLLSRPERRIMGPTVFIYRLPG